MALDLDPYVKKLLNARRRVVLVNNILQNAQVTEFPASSDCLLFYKFLGYFSLFYILGKKELPTKLVSAIIVPQILSTHLTTLSFTFLHTLEDLRGDGTNLRCFPAPR